MQQATERKIKELNEERERAVNAQRSTLQNQHTTEMANLKKQQDQIVADRNNQIQQYQQMQSNLHQQIHQAHVQIQQLQNRPRKSRCINDIYPIEATPKNKSPLVYLFIYINAHFKISTFSSL
jgi:DNA repair exonuclease SbcCD ATPase subunit